jgi:hypothetical protein
MPLDLRHKTSANFFGKNDFWSWAGEVGLVQRLRASLLRADTVRRRMSASISLAHGEMAGPFLEWCGYFVERVSMDLMQRLDKSALDARRAELRAADIENIYRNACFQLENAGRIAPLA